MPLTLMVLLGNWQFLLAQTTLSLGYTSNLGVAGRLAYVQGVSLTVKHTITPRFLAGVSIRYIQNPIAPDPEKFTGLPVAGWGVDWRHWPVSGLIEYQLTDKRIKPYVGLEMGVFMNHFKAVPNGPSLKKNVSFGTTPKLGIRTTISKIGVFAEGLFLWQTINQVQHQLGETQLNRGYFVANTGLTFSI